MRESELPTLADLGRLKVVDEDGSFLGNISGLDVDTDSGDVSRIEVRKTNALGLGGETLTLTRDRIVTVGAELMTVRHAPA